MFATGVLPGRNSPNLDIGNVKNNNDFASPPII